MDLGQIKRKVENKEYSLFSQFEDDFRLMLRNCFAYNGPGTYVYNEGVTLEALFEKELANIRGKEHDETQNMTIIESPIATPRETTATVPTPTKVKSITTTLSSSAPPTVTQPTPVAATDVSTTPVTSSFPPVVKERAPKVEQQRKKSITTVDSSSMPSPSHPSISEKQLSRMSEKEKMEAVLLGTMTNKHAFEFLRPVDPIKQGIPHYTQIIKTPMDLGKIKSRFKNNQYPNAQAMDSDMRLMFRNCYTFNPPNTYVYDESKKLEEAYDQEWQTYFGKATRRGSTELKKPKESKHVALPVSPAAATTSSTATTTTASPMIKIKAPQEKAKPVTITSPVASSSKSPQAPTPVAAAAVPTSSSEKTKSPKPVTINPAMNENNTKRCDRILKKLWAHQASHPFYEPVDAVALNIPQYYEVIKRPMDLSAIRKKYDTNQYSTIWEFEQDIRQIFWNCYSFNNHESWVAKQCQALETFFNQIWSAEFAHPNALKGEDKRLAQKVVNKLTFHDAAALFNEPVDLESLPDYGQIVKHPMDLRTIWEKLESGKYTSIKAVDQDVRLVFKNCYEYNAPGTYGNDQGKKLEKYYQNISREMRARIAAASSPGTAANGATTASPKRPHSSSPAPTKSTSSTPSTTAMEGHPPVKKLKATHHTKSTMAAPVSTDAPIMTNAPAASANVPAISTTTMEGHPSAKKLKSTHHSKSTVATPASTDASITTNVPAASVNMPFVEPMEIDPVVLKSPSTLSSPTIAKSPKPPLHPTLLSKMESLLIKMMNRKESFGFLEPVSLIKASLHLY
jgi:transcription initiation factor TFIID subunit 2